MYSKLVSCFDVDFSLISERLDRYRQWRHAKRWPGTMMGREEQDREDLLREATGLVVRAQLRIRGFHESILIGFRRNGCCSVFMEPNIVYQFNSANELRRGFLDGRLLKAEKRRLASLERVRIDRQVQLQRHDLDSHEANAYLRRMREHLTRIRIAIQQGEFTVEGQVPVDSDVSARILAWLQSIPDDVPVAQTPRAV